MHTPNFRYISIQHKFKSIGLAYLYWPIGSLLGIHLLPTLLVFMGCCSIHVAMHSSLSFDLFDVLGTIVTVTAVLIEAVAVSNVSTISIVSPSINPSSIQYIHQSQIFTCGPYTSSILCTQKGSPFLCPIINKTEGCFTLIILLGMRLLRTYAHISAVSVSSKSRHG